jgi:hypothetical protein
LVDCVVVADTHGSALVVFVEGDKMQQLVVGVVAVAEAGQDYVEVALGAVEPVALVVVQLSELQPFASPT